MNNKNIPIHVAIIMDGNGRWARRRGLPRNMGHRAGVRTIENIIEESMKLGIKILTLYTFSVENWKRPKKEIDTLMRLLKEYLAKRKKDFSRNGIRLNVIGRMSDLASDVQEQLKETMTITKDNSKLILNLALNYGGRTEIIDAVKKIAEDVKKTRIKVEDVDENIFSSYLYTPDLPDPDFLIRTSGEERISNFLLWQLSYTELYFTKKFWPSFSKTDFRHAIEVYQTRKRRFGGI